VNTEFQQSMKLRHVKPPPGTEDPDRYAPEEGADLGVHFTYGTEFWHPTCKVSVALGHLAGMISVTHPVAFCFATHSGPGGVLLDWCPAPRARLALDRPKTNHRAEPLPVPEQGTLFA